MDHKVFHHLRPRLKNTPTFNKGECGPSGEMPLNKTFQFPRENLYSLLLHNGFLLALSRDGA